MTHSLPTVNWVEFLEGGDLRPSFPLPEIVAAVAAARCGGIGLDDVSVGHEGIEDLPASRVMASPVTSAPIKRMSGSAGGSTWAPLGSALAAPRFALPEYRHSEAPYSSRVTGATGGTGGC